MQKLIDAEKSDVFDVLEYVAFAVAPITRAERVDGAKSNIFALLNHQQRDFLDFVLSKYVESGVGELDEAKLPHLLELKYHSVHDGVKPWVKFRKSAQPLSTFKNICIDEQAKPPILSPLSSLNCFWAGVVVVVGLRFRCSCFR